MIANQNFYDTCFTIFYPTASATVYGRRPKFFRAKHSATAEGENCPYGPTLPNCLMIQPIQETVNKKKIEVLMEEICNYVVVGSCELLIKQ